MYKKILVPIDESETCDLAFQEAIKLAVDQKATLRLIRVVDEYILTTAQMAIDYEEYEKVLKQYSKTLLEKMKTIAEKAGVTVETSLIEITEYSERIPQKIIDESVSCQADLIVIGTHGRRGFNRFMLGSVAEGVVRLATIPVLLIRGGK